MFPQCRRTTPLEAAMVMASPQRPADTQEMDEAMHRVRQMEADLMVQQREMEISRQQVELQQEHMARSALAQQQQQEVLAAANSRLSQEQEAMWTGRTQGMPTPGRLPEVLRPAPTMVPVGGDSDADLSGTP